MDAEAYAPLKKMFADAKAAGVPLALVSSFRSIKLQDSLFNDYDGGEYEQRYEQGRSD